MTGISLEGEKFFYPNPLVFDGKAKFNQGAVCRKGWFDCSCCPGNVARLLPSMKQYIWSETTAGINLNLFIGSAARLTTPDGEADVVMETGYPWNGDVKVTVSPSTVNSRFTLGIRIPGWTGGAPVEGNLYSYVTPAKGKVGIKVNGRKFKAPIADGFAHVDREWKKGDVVKIFLPMEPRFIKARKEVEADSGRVAIGVGPIVYCLEQADNGPVREVTADTSVKPVFAFEQQLLGGVGILKFPVAEPGGQTREAKAVPYYSWANRGRGEMTVWIRTTKP